MRLALKPPQDVDRILIASRDRPIKDSMDIGQTARNLGRRVKAAFLGLTARARDTADRAGAAAGDLSAAGHHFPPWSRIAIGVVVVVILFYPVRACWVSTIDDDTAFFPKRVDAGQSAGVAAMAALIDREVNDHGWVVNSPWFTPTGMLLDDMPNYQRGIVAGLSRFGPWLQSRFGRAGAVIDPDLAQAARGLAYRPDVYLWDWSQSVGLSGSSGGAYKDAMEALQRYNARLSSRRAVFERSAGNFAALLSGVMTDLQAASDLIDAGIMGAGPLTGSEMFYRTKGSLYAQYIVLQGFGKDFAAALDARRLNPTWIRMMADLRAAASMRSGAVRKGAPGVVPSPCDLCTQGFFIMRARLAMGTIVESLRR
jgi:hypothetical protein